MDLRFVIIDDDMGIRKIINNIIEKYELGIVIGECGDGLAAEKLIPEYNPDIILVDLLLPGQDGLELVKKLSAVNMGASYIMISQSGSQPMITQAYQSGIDFYIHKPINVLEIVSVIRKVAESRRLKQFMSLISQTTAQYVNPQVQTTENDESIQKTRIYRIFSDVGIIGESGVKNIYQISQLIAGKLNNGQEHSYQLHEIYQQLSVDVGQDTKTIEQRVRRTIAKALQNVANMGIDDYHNDKFQLYSSTLFDFKETRQEMNYILGKSSYHGKINIKKFVEGILFLAEE